jgi:hypothetical protein
VTTTTVFALRTAILLMLILLSVFDWKRTRLLEEMIRVKDALLQVMEDRSLKQATDDMIREAAQATEGGFYIHLPATGCPDGWKLVPELFTESDGTTRPGCIRMKSQTDQFRGDYLKPGEGVSLELMIPLPASPRQPRNGKL